MTPRTVREIIEDCADVTGDFIFLRRVLSEADCDRERALAILERLYMHVDTGAYTRAKRDDANRDGVEP